MITEASLKIKDNYYEVEPFGKNIRRNKGKVVCHICKKEVYRFNGEFKSKVNPKDFTPLTGKKLPKEGESINCPECKNPLAFDLESIGLVVFKYNSKMTKEKYAGMIDKDGVVDCEINYTKVQ